MQRSLKLLLAVSAAGIFAAGCSTAEPESVPDPEAPSVPEAPKEREPEPEKGLRWITIGTDALPTAQMALDERKRNRVLTPVAMNSDVALLSFDAEDFQALSELMHVRHSRCGGFIVHETLEEAEQALRSKGNADLVVAAPSYVLDNAATVNGMLAELQPARMQQFIESLSAFQNRYYTSTFGVQSSNFIFDQWRSIAASRPDITVERFTHTWAQSSVIVTIPGSTLASEVVIIGGHQDSISSGGATSIAPGADDDASGIATITEVLRAIVARNFRPLRTVKIMAYAAEEAGLRGSGAIAADYQARGVNVVGVTQFDMTLFKPTGSTADIWLMNDFTNAAQNAFMVNLVNTYVGATVSTASACGYGCSDHASWHNRGYAASMPFEARMNTHNGTIHTPNDRITAQNVSINHGIKFARLGVAYVAELAKGTLGGQPPANTAPTVSISSPSAGATVGAQVTLTGASNDTQDGNLSGSIRWSSNVGGSLGQGASLNVTLAAGAHTVTASVTDSGGLTSTTTVSFTVTAGGPLFSDNFEGTPAWTFTGLWHKVTSSTCATPGHGSAVSALYYGRDAQCNYAPGGTTTGTATSPSISGASASSTVSFKYFRQVESSSSGNYDITSLEAVSGTTTTVLWTRSSTTPSATSWQDSGPISLSAFAGRTFQLRLRFNSVDGTANTFVGWLVDDIVVTR